MAQFDHIPWSYSSSIPAAPLTPPMMPYDAVTVRDASDDYLSAFGAVGLPYQLGLPFVPSQHALYDTPPGPSYKGYPSIPSPVIPGAGAAMTAKAPRMVDMNMAASGSQAAMAGIHTSLAQYTAQMVVWLWFGTPSSPIQPPNSPLGNPFNTHTPLNPHQVAPTPVFANFVERLLRITMVSHSVTLIALLYLHRLKSKNDIRSAPGTETRPFIASLILSNKYLDDNTYTNKTWAELTSLPVGEINRMEQEFLRGLDFRLSVDKSDYKAWKDMLDGFIYAREREAQRWAVPNYIRTPMSNVSPNTSYIPAQSYMDLAPRARSASPMDFSPPRLSVSPSHPRKRSAIDAFAEPSHEMPARKAQLNIAPEYNGVVRSTYGTPVQTTSGLGRSSSLNRRIARMPNGLRRGSVGQVYAAGEEDLLHAATQHALMQNARARHDGEYISLVAPYDEVAPQSIPPEHLIFYTLAASRHPGQDGAPRKAILRHQTPHPFSYPPHHPSYQAPQVHEYDVDGAMVSNVQTPNPSYYTHNPPALGALGPIDLSYPGYLDQSPLYPNSGPVIESRPGNFANAGPAGYLYDPHSRGYTPSHGQYGREYGQNPHSQAQAYARAQATGYGDAALPNPYPESRHGQYGHGQQWQTRSEWSSPVRVAWQ